MIEVADGIRRLTFPLPFGLDHVHCYLVRRSDGLHMLVDAGLGLPGAEARWTPVLAGLDGPLERVVVTHFHPDHVGDSSPVAELASAPVFQGRADFEQCRRTWGEARSTEFSATTSKAVTPLALVTPIRTIRPSSLLRTISK